MADLQTDVNARIAELQKLYADTAELVPGYSYETFINSLKGELHKLTIRANGIMHANVHLDNEAVRIELIALRCVIGGAKEYSV